MATSTTMPDAETWSGLLRAVLTPVFWLGGFQQQLVAWLLDGPSAWSVAVKIILLMLPSLVLIGGLWCTILSGYTLLVRTERRRFATALLLAWWDLAGSLWMFWGGLLRFVVAALMLAVAIGRLTLRLVAEAIQYVVLGLAAAWLLGRRRYFRGGLPWVALLLLLAWCVVEAGALTLVLFPGASRVLVEVVGVEPPAAFGPALHLALLLVAAASFACLHLFLGALERGGGRRIAGRVAALVVVMSFEITVLYRALVDAVAPWIATRTGLAIGFTAGMTLAMALWIAVRVPTWLLFARFGVPPMNALIARTSLETAEPERSIASREESAWRMRPVGLRDEIEWLQQRTDEMIDGVILSLLQMPAALLNLGALMVASRPVFALPLRSSKELSAAREHVQRSFGEAGG